MPLKLERRMQSAGRRSGDLEPREHCLEHSGIVTAVTQLKETDKEHSLKLDKILSKNNFILGSLCLSLLLLLINVLIELIKGG